MKAIINLLSLLLLLMGGSVIYLETTLDCKLPDMVVIITCLSIILSSSVLVISFMQSVFEDS
jgi:hypothetical protein